MLNFRNPMKFSSNFYSAENKKIFLSFKEFIFSIFTGLKPIHFKPIKIISLTQKIEQIINLT